MHIKTWKTPYGYTAYCTDLDLYTEGDDEHATVRALIDYIRSRPRTPHTPHTPRQCPEPGAA